MTELRVIKKYPNRRLYDTEESRYIRLADVRSLVLNDVPLVVVDKRSGADITRSILLQVIAEEEQRPEPLLSQAFLWQVIKAQDRLPAAAVAGQLEQCLSGLLQRDRPVVPVHRGRWPTLPDDRRPASPADSAGEAGEFAVDRQKAG
jgi:polyhydroxyalkanoate synthesis repressor PhaR